MLRAALTLACVAYRLWLQCVQGRLCMAWAQPACELNNCPVVWLLVAGRLCRVELAVVRHRRHTQVSCTQRACCAPNARHALAFTAKGQGVLLQQLRGIVSLNARCW